MPKSETRRYRALTDLSLRKSADPKDDAYNEWLEWKAGDIFRIAQKLQS